MLAINGMPDHIHFLIGMKPSCCLSDLVRDIEKATNEFIKSNRFSKFTFLWQEGFGAFAYSHSQLNDVIAYILNQKKHHQTKTFREEYTTLLVKFEVVFQEQVERKKVSEICKSALFTVKYAFWQSH